MNHIQLLKTDEEWDEAWPAIQSLRTDLDRDRFIQSRNDMIDKGYELFGLRAEGRIVSVAGLIIYPHLLRTRDCWVHDFATLGSERSKGYGKQLIRFVENHSKLQGCTRICLHTRLHRTEAQRFYEEHAHWEKAAFVYMKEL